MWLSHVAHQWIYSQVRHSLAGVTSATVSVILDCGSLTFPGEGEKYKLSFIDLLKKKSGEVKLGPLSCQSRSPHLTTRLFFLWGLSNDHVYVPIWFLPESVLIFGQELQAQLQKSRQPRYVTPGMKFVIGGVFALLHMEVSETVTLIYQAKLDVSGYISVYLFFIYQLVIKCMSPLRVWKILLKHPVCMFLWL